MLKVGIHYGNERCLRCPKVAFDDRRSQAASSDSLENPHTGIVESPYSAIPGCHSS